MKRAFAAVFLFSAIAMADGKGWEKPIFVDACGMSQGEAWGKVKREAENEENFYRSICEGNQGKLSTRWSKPRCEPDPQNLTCRVICSLSGTAACTF